MQKALTLYDTTIGKKAVMAITGIVLYGFVIGHMLGNLQVYLGPQALNDYAAKLREFGPLLWLVRGFLLAMLVLHLIPAYQLTVQSWPARGTAYQQYRDAATGYAARTMWISGPLILFFLLYHLAHFTVPGVAMSSGYEHSHADVYANVVSGFSIPWVAALYVAAQAFLTLHLYHGGTSLLQTLGFNHPRYRGTSDTIARTFALLIFLGNTSIPLAVYVGLVK